MNNVLVKIEIKSSTTTNYSVTSGQRGGLSIRTEVKSGNESREEILKKDDADFFVGFSLIDASCCIVPIELVSYIAKPISLGVRLFINLMAGHTLLKVIVPSDNLRFLFFSFNSVAIVFGA